MADELAQYSFVPWLRQGLATSVSEVDNLGVGTGSAKERAQLTVELSLSAAAAPGVTAAPSAQPIEKVLSLVGPGDIVGVKREAIIRTQPAHGAQDFAASDLAYVEFYEEDFPWRFTPARHADRKLRPWIALLVLRAEEFERGLTVQDRPPSIRVLQAAAAAALPPHAETWAWAHVQISRPLVAGADTETRVDATIREHRDHALSRLLCPRKLVPDTTYHAFLVPAFETGRRRGLGLDSAHVAAQEPAWRTGTLASVDFPVYHEFSFRTSAHGDFESLVRLLKAGPVGEQFGKRPLDVSTPGYGMDGVPSAPSVVELEGALRPPGEHFERVAFPAQASDPFTTRLCGILDLSVDLEEGVVSPSAIHPYHVDAASGAYESMVDDPIVTPPAYGQRHANLRRVADARQAGSTKPWVGELNLDLRSRAAAGLGVEVVRERQEELMERAWQQVGELDQANQRLREAELALAVSEALFAKHLATASDDRALRLTAQAQPRVLGTQTGQNATTVRAEVRASKVPSAAQSAAFKRISRPQRKLIRRLSPEAHGATFHAQLLGRFNAQSGALTAAQALAAPAVAMPLTSVWDAVDSAVTSYQEEQEAGHVLLLLLAPELKERRKAGTQFESMPLDTATGVKEKLKQALQAMPGLPVARRQRAQVLIEKITSIGKNNDDANQALVKIDQAAFDEDYGTAIKGKEFRGVTVTGNGTTGATEIARMADPADLAEFRSSVSLFRTAFDAIALPAAPASLSGNGAPLAARLRTELRPKHALVKRIESCVSGYSARPPEETRRLQPVLAHPKFPDPMFEDLRRRSQDFIIPNYRDLPPNTLTILEPNQRFIESYLAGLNEEMARELLWREYPTDQRGTYFDTFWDTRDNLGPSTGASIKPMHMWTGELGQQKANASNILVFVVRGELLRKYPNTVVYAHAGKFVGGDPQAPREFAAETPEHVKFPIFRGQLEPDIALFGFNLSIPQAKGSREAVKAGWFFVLKERPGEVNFGLDDRTGSPLLSWNDLGWGNLTFSAQSPEHISVAANAPVLSGPNDPSLPRAGSWGRSSADQAYILLQNPVLYARHASELLP